MKAFCALRLLGPNDAQELLLHLNSNATNDVAEIWRYLLKDLGAARIIMAKEDLADPLSMREHLEHGTLPPELADVVDLILGSESVAQWWDGQPELVSARRFDLADTLVKIQRLDREPTFPSGTSRGEIWEKLWRRPAELSTQVWVCSPYLFGKDAFAESAPRRLRHVTWLLDRLHTTMPSSGDVQVHLLSGEWSYDIADVNAGIGESAFCRHRPGALKVHIAPWRLHDAGNVATSFYGPHDRHIRFSCNAAFDVPSDFDRLRREMISEDQGFKCHYIGPGPSIRILEAVEHGVMEHARSFTFGPGGLSED